MKKKVISFFMAIIITISVIPPISGSALTNTQQKKLDKAVAEIMKLVKNDMSDIEKVIVLHDWMVQNVAYDYDALYSNNYKNSGNECGSLVEHKAICDGYANGFMLLLDKAGVENKKVVGTANGYMTGKWNGHAWNMVKLNGKWYHIDTTWDATTSEYPYHHYNYFLVSDDYISKNHRFDKKSTGVTAKTSFFGQKENTVFYDKDNSMLWLKGDMVIFRHTTQLDEYKRGNKITITSYNIKTKKLQTISKNAFKIQINDNNIFYYDNEEEKIKLFDIDKSITSNADICIREDYNNFFVAGNFIVYSGYELSELDVEYYIGIYDINKKTNDKYNEITYFYYYTPVAINDYIIFNSYNGYFSINGKTGEVKKQPVTVTETNISFNWQNIIINGNNMYFTDKIDIFHFNRETNHLVKMKRPEGVGMVLDKFDRIDINKSKTIDNLHIEEKNGNIYLIWTVINKGQEEKASTMRHKI